MTGDGDGKSNPRDEFEDFMSELSGFLTKDDPPKGKAEPAKVSSPKPAPAPPVKPAVVPRPVAAAGPPAVPRPAPRPGGGAPAPAQPPPAPSAALPTPTVPARLPTESEEDVGGATKVYQSLPAEVKTLLQSPTPILVSDLLLDDMDSTLPPPPAAVQPRDAPAIQPASVAHALDAAPPPESSDAIEMEPQPMISTEPPPLPVVNVSSPTRRPSRRASGILLGIVLGVAFLAAVMAVRWRLSPPVAPVSPAPAAADSVTPPETKVPSRTEPAADEPSASARVAPTAPVVAKTDAAAGDLPAEGEVPAPRVPAASPRQGEDGP